MLPLWIIAIDYQIDDFFHNDFDWFDDVKNIVQSSIENNESKTKVNIHLLAMSNMLVDLGQQMNIGESNPFFFCLIDCITNSSHSIKSVTSFFSRLFFRCDFPTYILPLNLISHTKCKFGWLAI